MGCWGPILSRSAGGAGDLSHPEQQGGTRDPSHPEQQGGAGDLFYPNQQWGAGDIYIDPTQTSKWVLGTHFTSNST